MERRTPESYLTQAEAEEKRANQGSLKIYLGAAPGVGKTYQMLSDALVKRAQGIDVVIGVVETHGRHEVESLASAFEKIKTKLIKKDNFTLRTLDLDAIYKRSPGLILIDEAAFSNPDGSIHPKRWQDILDIIERGIDVYTTLNIQHLESLNDVVGRLIGIPVYETVPDAFLEQAAVIELIDLPSEELITRLKEGKVYLPAEVSVAIHHFFKKGNLDALRELALRIAAERVGSEVESDYTKSLSSRLLYQEDTLLVCINEHVDMNSLIRAAKRISSRLNCPWHALFIDTGDQKSFFIAQQYLHFAQSLGAKTHVVFASDVASAIEDFIEQQKITQVVLGKQKNLWWRPTGLFEKLAFHLKDIGIYLIELPAQKLNWLEKIKKQFSIKKIALMIFLVVTATAMVLFKNIFSPWDFGWLTGLFILGIAYFGAWRWVFFLMFLFIGLDLLFNARSFEFLMSDTGAWLRQYGSWSLLFLSLSAYLIYAKKQILLAREIERHNSQILSFYQVIAHARGIEAILVNTNQYLKKYFKLNARFFLYSDSSLKQVFPKDDESLSDKEQGIVQWVYESGEEAGIGTGNLIFSKAYYLPIATSEGIFGVARFEGKHDVIMEAQKKILMVLMQQLSTNLQLEMQQQQQKLQDIHAVKFQVKDDILRKFSEQFYKPFSQLTEKLADTVPNAEYFKDLVRLKNHLKVIHFLSFEKNKERKTLQNIVKIIEEVVHDNSDVWLDKNIHWSLPENIPEVKVNYDLIYILVDNLLDNIAIHANPSEGIDIEVIIENQGIRISLADYGPGFSEKELQKIFESFYQGHQAQSTGLGLGLALCERIVSWHGGKIWAKNRPPRGAIFFFSLPMHT